MFILLLFLLIIALVIEGTITTLPLVLVCLILLAAMRRESVFFFAFLSGIILDIFAVRPLGTTSVFFLVILFLVLLYQRKYEIFSLPFVAIASFIASMMFLFFFHYPTIFLQSLLNALLASMVFMILRFFSPEHSRDHAVPAKAGIQMKSR